MESEALVSTVKDQFSSTKWTAGFMISILKFMLCGRGLKGVVPFFGLYGTPVLTKSQD